MYIKLLLIILFFQFGICELLTFTSEENYMNELLSLGYETQMEDFEGSAWDYVRSNSLETNASPYVENNGITWTGNENITTNTNWGVDNTWGLFTPFDPVSPSVDYIEGNSETILYGIGCWIKSNAPGADMGIYLDDVLSSHENTQFSGHTFYGVINTDGFINYFIEDTEHESVFGVDNFIFAINFSILTGDVNFDDEINVLDVVLMVSFILGEPTDEYEYSAGDINQDGILNILDVVALISIILGN